MIYNTMNNLSKTDKEMSFLKKTVSKLIMLNIGVFRFFSNRRLSFKIFAVLCVVYAFVLYKSRRRKVTKIYKKTKTNKEVVDHLRTLIKAFWPTFYLPTAISMIVFGMVRNRYSFTFEKQFITLPDKGEILCEWFPANFADMDPKTPIVVFNYGLAGSSQEFYSQELCQLIKEKGWRMVIVNRRGFGFSELKNKNFMQKEEIKDLKYVVSTIHDVFQLATMYMIGISAGANFSSCYMGSVKEKTPVRAYVSISNPFNLGRISFTMRYKITAGLISKGFAASIKGLYNQHRNNPHFQNLLKRNFSNYSRVNLQIKNANDVWELDKNVTRKLGGFDHVLEYYRKTSSEHFIDYIKRPTLFINNAEDPICIKETIPIEKIYDNENCVLLINDRGGHVEYFSGWKADWWGFKTALAYFDYFEKRGDGFIFEA